MFFQAGFAFVQEYIARFVQQLAVGGQTADGDAFQAALVEDAVLDDELGMGNRIGVAFFMGDRDPENIAAFDLYFLLSPFPGHLFKKAGEV